MRNKNITVDGKLFLNEISFDKCIKTIAKKHNATASRVYLPIDWVGKTVFVVQEKVSI
jgi:hypothetical protein